MIYQDGAVHKATARDTDSITVPGINVTESHPNRLLVVAFGAKGQQIGSSRVGDVTYGGGSLTFVSKGSGAHDFQSGGAWIYTMLEPEDGLDLVIKFEDLIADEIAVVATVFHGVDQRSPFGFAKGDYTRSLDFLVAPKSEKSRFLCLVASGVGPENSFAMPSVSPEFVTNLEVEVMSINVAVTESRGLVEQDIGVSFTDDRSLNAFAVVELLPAFESAVMEISQIGINNNVVTVASGTNSGNGSSIRGNYGMLTIGADGSYDYLPDAEVENRLAPGEDLVEEFFYILSDGTDSVEAVLPVPVTRSAPSATLEEVDGGSDVTPPGSATAELAVTEIKFEDGPPFPVQWGTTSADGTTIQGNYGTLSIGADGSYSYLTNPKGVEGLSVTEKVSELFTYVLSNGTDSMTTTLAVDVKGTDEELVPTGDQAPSSEEVFAITEIAAGDGHPVLVAPGSTSTFQATKIDGSYGTLEIGADGSWEYFVKSSLDGSRILAPVERFVYTLSNGIQRVPKELTFKVDIPEKAERESVVVPGGEESRGLAPKVETPPAPSPPPVSESSVFRVTFDGGVGGAAVSDFEVSGVPNATITAVTEISERCYDLTVDAVDLMAYKGNFSIKYVGTKQAPVQQETILKSPVDQTPEEIGVSESQNNEFYSTDMIVSSGAMTSFSDFSTATYIAEVDSRNAGVALEAGTDNSTFVDSPSLSTTMAGGIPAPRAVEITEGPFVNLLNGGAGANLKNSGALPLSAIIKLFSDANDRRFFGGVKVVVEESQIGRISFVPYFAGCSLPGASIQITIKDMLGIEKVTTSEAADSAGLWTSTLQINLESEKYLVTIEETRASWDNTAFPDRSIVAEYFGGIGLSPNELQSLVPDQIIGGVLKGRSLEEFVSETSV